MIQQNEQNSKFFFEAIVAIAIIFVLINPTYGSSIDLKLNTKYEDIVLISWNYSYEEQLDFYTISVIENGTKREILRYQGSINDEFPGEHSPIIGEFRIGKPNAGSYLIELSAKLTDPEMGREIIFSELLNVSEDGKVFEYLYKIPTIPHKPDKNAFERDFEKAIIISYVIPSIIILLAFLFSYKIALTFFRKKRIGKK